MNRILCFFFLLAASSWAGIEQGVDRYLMKTQINQANGVAGLDAQGILEEQVLASGNTHDWWFVPTIESLAYGARVVSTNSITNYADIITYEMEVSPLAYTLGYDIIASNHTETVEFFSADGVFEVNQTTGVAISQVGAEGEIILRSPTLDRSITLRASVTAPGDIGYFELLDQHVYVTNSVKQHINDTFETIFTPATDSPTMYEFIDHDTMTYIRDPTCWASQLDMTCCSPYNSAGINKRTVTLITPKHCLSSKHYYPPIGSEVYFVANTTADYGAPTNDVFYATIVAATEMAGDSVVLRLAQTLPAEYTPAKRLPADWEDYMPYTQSWTNAFNNKQYHENYPIVMTDQNYDVGIGESFLRGLATAVTPDFSYGGYLPAWCFYIGSAPNEWSLFQNRRTHSLYYFPKVAGDSSNPMLLYINGEPVLLGTLTMGGGGSAWYPLSDPANADAVQDAITAWGDTNIWESVDLSGFVTFERVD